METNIKSLISVIIPCFNDHEYIKEAINSINNQTYKNLEIIIVDDGSNIDSKDVLQNIKQENLTILYQKNAGPSAARNNGIKKAKGDFILTLDADDYFEATFVEKGILILEKYSNVGLVTCNGFVFDDKGVKDEIISKSGDANDFLFCNSAIGNSLFRKKCWSEIGGFDDKMRKGYEDWDFHISLLKANWKIKVIEEHLFYYRNKPNSRNKKANKVKYDLTNYVLMKHKDLSIQNFDKLLLNFLVEFKSLSANNETIRKSLDYRIGRSLLSPFRYLKKYIFKQF